MVPCETFVPRARGTFVSPDGGVAKAFPPYTAPPTSTSTRASSEFRLMPFPFRTRLRAGNGPRTPSVDLVGCVQHEELRARRRRQALPPDGRSAVDEAAQRLLRDVVLVDVARARGDARSAVVRRPCSQPAEHGGGPSIATRLPPLQRRRSRVEDQEHCRARSVAAQPRY